MKIYVLKDTISNSLVTCFVNDNREAAMRTIRTTIDMFVEQKNSGALAIWKDCDLFEVQFEAEGTQKVIKLSDLFVSDKENVCLEKSK